MAGPLVVAVRDQLVLARLEALAERLHQDVVSAEPPGLGDGPAALEALEGRVPVAFLVELELPGAIDRITDWRRRFRGVLVAGSIRVPDQELWHGALAAGADLVANRGTFVVQLERALAARLEGSGPAGSLLRLPVRLMERDGDGLVGRLPDAPGGSIAILRIGAQLYAIRDECPHAGASLSDGVLADRIITCPRHGSQFDVTTGARERGPSDFPIRTYRVTDEAGAVAVEVPD